MAPAGPAAALGGGLLRPAFLPLLLLACLGGHLGLQVLPDMECHTDFDQEVFCHWDGLGTTNCAGEFQLHVRNNAGHSWKCIPEDRRKPELGPPHSCVCSIHGKVTLGAKYTFSLVTTRTNESKANTVILQEIVKPRPLHSLTVTKSERRSFILAWKKSYPSSWLLNDLEAFCQIQLATEGQEQPELRNVTEQAERYEIFSYQLLPGKNYSARIRYRLVGWGTFWSDWSRPCWWINDFGPQPEERLWGLVLLACGLGMGLVSACYCCLARLKRQWWDRIPRPEIANDLGRKPGPVQWHVLPLGNEGRLPRGATSQEPLEKPRSCLYSLLLSAEGAAFPGQPEQVAKGPTGNGWWGAVLTPEAPAVEPYLTVCSPPTAEPSPEGAPREEEGEESPVPGNNASLVNLFLDILVGGDSPEDASLPEPVGEEPPPAQAPEAALGGLRSHGWTSRMSLEGSSECGCRNATVAASSWGRRSLAPEQPLLPQGSGQPFPSSQYKMLLFPSTAGSGQLDSQCGAATPQPSCYKSFSSLVGQTTASSPQLWGHPSGFPGVDPAQPCGREDAPSWSTPDVACPPGACLPFQTASLDASCLLHGGSPYKPLPEVLGTLLSPKKAPWSP